MTETMQVYVKNTSNCEGMSLQTFEVLSKTWTGESVFLRFENSKRREVIGMTDLSFGTPCDVHITKVRTGEAVGFLVWGGNSGVRILDRKAEVTEFDGHLPRGYGRPVVWVEDEKELPAIVRRVVGAPV